MIDSDIAERVRIIARHGMNSTWLGLGTGESGIRMTVPDGCDEVGLPQHKKIEVSWAELLELAEGP